MNCVMQMKTVRSLLFAFLAFGLAGLTSCQFVARTTAQPTVEVIVVTSSPPPTLPSRINDTWSLLRQHVLEIPPLLLSNHDCLRGQSRVINPAFGEAIGTGPVFAVGLSPDATLNFVGSAPSNQFSGSAWGGAKVLWVVAPDYLGPVLIRGRQIDGPNEVRFDAGDDPSPELHIEEVPPSSNSDWRSRASFTRLLAPGCYVYQVDGQNFSEWISFKAIETNS